MCFWVSYFKYQAFMAHIVWYSENIDEKHLNFIQSDDLVEML